MKKIMLVFGTRPEAIKMCPLVNELKTRKSLETIVCVTGQHRQMLDQVLNTFNVVPDYDLSIMKQGQTLFDITTGILEKIKAVLEEVKPDVVLVHGDTSTTFVTALACFYLQIPVGHVEAGLRTYNIYSPYPEEFNRQAVSIISQYNFAPTQMAADNLIKEGKDPSKIFITGNTVIDAMQHTVKEDYTHPELEWVGDDKLIFITAHRRENLGEPMHNMFRAIRRVLDVGMAAQYVLEDMARIPVRVELASEFRYRSMAINRNALVIAISQSGETADTLAALRLAKEKGMTTLAIVNVVGSSIAREADKVFYTLAGPEISVATTKAYSAQLAAMYCIAVEFALVRGKITEEQYAYYISELLTIAPKINKILEDKERLQWFAAKYAGAHDVFFVGRGIDYAVSLEGSLKLKEISYIHSEAYAAGELKHGTISLIEPGTLVIGVLTQSKLYEKTMSNMVECRSRGAYLLGLTTYGKYEIEETVDFAVYVPRIDEYFAGSLAVVPLQLLGYYVSVAKGLDVDKPRNLAKSVTVE